MMFSFWDFTAVTCTWGATGGSADAALVVSWRQDAEIRHIARRTEKAGVAADFMMSP
jgi:hypothetical protein